MKAPMDTILNLKMAPNLVKTTSYGIAQSVLEDEANKMAIPTAFSIEGDLSTFGCNIRPNTIIGLVGVAKCLVGNWYVKEVDHTLDRNGYTTRIKCSRYFIYGDLTDATKLDKEGQLKRNKKGAAGERKDMRYYEWNAQDGTWLVKLRK